MVFTPPPIILTPKKKGLSKPLKILTSLKTTAVLGTVLGGLIAGPAAVGRVALIAAKAVAKRPKTFLIGAPAAAGILLASPTARKFVDPRQTFKRGKEIGKLIEDPSKLIPEKEETLLGKIKDVGIKAGLIGAGAAAVAGAAAIAVKKVKEKLPSKIPSAELPAAILPTVPSLTPRTQPLGAVEKPVEVEKVVAAQPVSMPSIRISNKPSINISFRKSRKFINQQVLVRQCI